MSSVKIKTEPTAAVAKVDVKVKLEPSLSTADIKHEQHTSDIDTKVESDSEADIKSESDDDDDEGTDQHQSQRQFICKHPGCGRSFNHTSNLRMHQYEHRLQTELNMYGKTYTLTRQSLNDRWSCPIPNCKSTSKTVGGTNSHIRRCHDNSTKQQYQQTPAQRAWPNHYFLGVDNFYVNGVRCGYHNIIGVFICYECKLVPESLLTHFQQKHGCDEKSIDNAVLPESAVNASADPNINQHTSNPHLATAISQPHHQKHQDIVKGWLCGTPNCGYSGRSNKRKNEHKISVHQGDPFSTVPALVLRLSLTKANTSCFFISRIDQASGAVITTSSREKQHKLGYNHNGLSNQDENEDDVGQSEATDTSSQKKQWKCEYLDCGRLFNSSDHLSVHRREHKLEVVVSVHGKTFVLSRQSLDDKWPCPVPGCEATYKLVDGIRPHIQNIHSTANNQKRANSDGDKSDQQQRPVIKRRQFTFQYINVDEFYVTGIKCGYHNSIRVFICYVCRLVPDCLLTHMQQKHGYSEKSIESAILLESVRIAGSDPNINQHTGNPHLAAAISQPYKQHHHDIVHGWLCVISDCGYCCSTKRSKNQHRYMEHRDIQQTTAPALVLRLLYGKTLTSCFLITRLDKTIKDVKSSNAISQSNSDCVDGEELVLSDYSDEDDIH